VSAIHHDTTLDAVIVQLRVGRTLLLAEVTRDAIGNLDMHAMWEFLNGPGYQVDITALRDAHPHLSWTSFADWASHAFGAAS